ncbi:MAG: hypothetical protein JW748_09520 [Anaerolineales bacterium]|nr:hypothetical protein [Anaerolineales bacterium]
MSHKAKSTPDKKPSSARPGRHPALSKKPLGLPTRGKTAPNRLRPTDTFLALCHAEFVRALPGLYVDLGYGETPQTTLESAARLRRLNPGLQFLGVEIEPARVAVAQYAAGPQMEFRLGGFNLPLRAGERAAVIRAMNVLRQYPEGEYRPSIDILARYLGEEGLLLEGTSDPPGRWMAFNVYRRRRAELAYDGLTFFARLRHPFSPRELQAVLPKNLIHHAEPGSPLDRFFGDWERCWRRAFRRAPEDPRHCFLLAARDLAADFGYPVDRRSILLARGFLRLTSIPGNTADQPSLFRTPPEKV